LTIHKKRNLSKSGILVSSACAKTRQLKAICDSSRFKNSSNFFDVVELAEDDEARIFYG
jgi:hypothetical protein